MDSEVWVDTRGAGSHDEIRSAFDTAWIRRTCSTLGRQSSAGTKHKSAELRTVTRRVPAP